MEFYTIDICDLRINLPVLTLPSSQKIAFFNLHGNVKLTEHCAINLAKIIKNTNCEVLLTAESKGLQLTHCIARILNHDYYAVARKSQKLYLKDGLSSTVRSITTEGEQKLYLSAYDAALLKNKNIGIIDDVISTGSSLNGLEDLVKAAGGNIALKAAVLAEGSAALRDDIVFLQSIPLL